MRKLKLDELNRHNIADYENVEKHPVTVVLDSIRSGMNVGSFFRTADAFKIERIILCGITAKPPHKEIAKTAIGATSSVDWSYESDISIALKALKKDGITIMGVEQTDRSRQLQTLEWEYPLALVFGNEVEGLSEVALPLLDGCIEIPQFGTKHSLNVSVCGGILLWEAIQPILNQ